MGIIRIILAISITISLVFAPAASSFAAPDGSGMEKMEAAAGTSMGGMDCHKGTGGSADSDCKCCDTKSMCLDQAACVMKCSKLPGLFEQPAKIALLGYIRHLPIALEKPPNWGSTPPSPPPRS